MGDPELSAPPGVPQPFKRSLEIAIVVFVTSLISAILATGAVFPPHLATVYSPALIAGLAAVMYYAGARAIMVPMLPGPLPP